MSFLLVSIAAICNAIMDVTQFHYHKSIFNRDGISESFWNGAISWRNKYINGDFKQGRNNIPVWFTDAFHFFKSSMIVCLCLAIITHETIVNFWIDFIILGTLWNLFFRMFYKHILRK